MLKNPYFILILVIFAISIITWITLTIYIMFAKNKELKRCDREHHYWYSRLKRAQFYGDWEEVNRCHQKISELKTYQAFWISQ